ncbi:PaaI family thioesterase [Mycobacteroides salmoniphilum]|uniref:Esterase n=1 Tax=Mycobacteroides salmoniphilum TaxID=404941 RepID=A0A4V3HZY9_9MYCO|nr:PaaI family thioesterase [Mycobacteroides salmoniphilum]TDZ91675.1 putative esterase [Mycobacteroides salmoniphilum]TDZ97315.1 putative esterase [Mycobacteroides salmoniphilum]TEA01546.1 putative esterase [Mycobacteroides salmoniphilum]
MTSERLPIDQFPGYLGIESVSYEDSRVTAELPLRAELFAPNGFVHAAAVVGLADTLCGYGCLASLPEGATGFTTIELKTNFLGTARDGKLVGTAVPVHRGRSTQLWDATVTSDDGRTLAVFRCTQLVLWPRG